MRTSVTLLAVAGVVAVLLVATVLVADSPYDRNVVSERNPFAPERPATLNDSTAAAYAAEYERTRLRNDLLASRGWTIDTDDEVRADCEAVSTTRVSDGAFRVRLRCRGDVDDTMRLLEPSGFSYAVAYRVSGETQTQLEIRGYPFDARDELRPRPDSARAYVP